MTLLTVNTGSTSVKLALFETGSGGTLARVHHQSLGSEEDCRAALAQLWSGGLRAPAAVAHRVVHGGERFSHPVLLDDSVLAAIEELSALAPLHNPVALRWIRAATAQWPGTAQVVVFDTSLFTGLPRVAAEYALPPSLGTGIGVRRYGFHGLAHEALLRSWCGLYPQLGRGGRLITLQLGGGCSVTAFRDGRPLDTSMGFSPLEGLVMATRSGDIDPAAVAYVQDKTGLSAAQVVQQLNENCGLAGVSGMCADPSALLGHGSLQAQFAIELYCYRIRKMIGAYLAVLGGCDGIVFGGGVGEHVPGVRARALQSLEWAGIALDPVLNDLADGGNALISAAHSAVRVHVAAVDEAVTLAQAAADLLPRG